MAENKSISGKKPGKPDLDYAGLRQEGIRHIREMASRIWTDHNTHDPGITMLESLCYAITDLGYRSGFPVEDLLASDPGNRAGNSPDFFQAHQVLPNRPLTINDYRKLLIDMPGIRNAWLEIAGDSEQHVFYDPVSIGLTYEVTAEPVEIRGLYNVRVEFEDDPELGDLNSPVLQSIFLAGGNPFNLEATMPYPDQVPAHWNHEGSVKNIDVILEESKQTAYDYVAHVKVKLEGVAKADHFDLHLRIREDKVLWKPDKIQVEARIKQLLEDKTPAGLFGRYQKKLLMIGSLLEEVQITLHQHRNLCEDFLKVEPVRIQEVYAEGEFEVSLDANPEELVARMLFEVHRFIDPPVNFLSLKEMLQKYSPEDIFEGPLLVHGFIEDENLRAFNDRGAIYTSDLLQILMNMTGKKVIAIKGLRLGNYIDNILITDDALNCLNLFKPEQYKPELSAWKSDLKLTKRGVEVAYDKALMVQLFEDMVAMAEPVKSAPMDVLLDQPQGRDRKTGKYFSVQEHLPMVYGISSAGLSDEVSAERKARARQLKGYMLFFDQLLANFLAQVSNLKNLFSMDPLVGKSYFEQAVYSVPGAMYMLKDFTAVQPDVEDKTAMDAAWELFTADQNNAYRTTLASVTEDMPSFLERRNRFLEHLMARFCEEFTDYSLLMFAANNQQVPAKLISDKISFMQELPSLGSQRDAALTLEGPGAVPWDTLNVSGLKHRVSRMLGFPGYTRKFLSPGDFKAIVFYQEADEDGIDEYRFRIVDENGQILLSSVKAYKVFESGYDIVLEVVAAGKNVGNYRIFPSVDGQFYFNLYNGADAEPIARRIDLFPSQQEAESHRDEVVDFMNSHFEGINDEPEEGVHIVEHLILRPRFKEGKGAGKIEDPLMPVVLDDFGNLTDEGKDPYSFRITAIFPASAKKLQDPGFKALADRLLRLETPAHVMPQVFFVDNIQLSRFEYAWKRWLELRTVPVPENPLQKAAQLQELSQALKELIASMQFLPEPY